MKSIFLIPILMAICGAVTSRAHGATKYTLTITNGSLMPISPAVVYVKSGAESAAPIGTQATNGFIQLCQSGDATKRAAELKSDASIKTILQTPGPILPGQSYSLEVSVPNPQQQSIHLETMYGKTKDTCGVGSLRSHSLVALKQHVSHEVIEKDDTLVTGAFLDPAIPEGMTYLDPSLCASATNAIGCIRELSASNSVDPKIRFATGYLPSLVTALEQKFGAEDIQTLLFPTSGAIQLKLKLIH